MSTLRTRIAGFRVDIVHVPSDTSSDYEFVPGHYPDVRIMQNFEATICPQFSHRETPKELRGSYQSSTLWSVLAPVTATIADFAYNNEDIYNANAFQKERWYAAVDYIEPILEKMDGMPGGATWI